jgi:hypothetical protein
MTAGRDIAKWSTNARAGAVCALALAVTLCASALSHVCAATTERVVTDRHTGLAIYGIDPVAYFTHRKPVMGRAEFEHRYAGAIWRFENEGNRAAFAADPKVYMPRFGGYDPVGIARGVSTPGYPELWTLIKDQLYLFYTAQTRAAFLADPAAAVAAAEARWAQVSRELSQ